ncbi:MAG: hypothetical protein V4694_06115 [Pseudomonadota bacterium]
MFTEMASTTLENIQKILGKKFIDIVLGIMVLSALTSVCFYVGLFRSLGIYMSDIDMSIFELFDIEIVVIIGIIYAIVYDKGIKHSHYHDGPLSTNYKTNSILIVSFLFLLMIFAIYQGPYSPDAVLSYLNENISLFFFPCIITGFFMWCLLSFNKRSAIEFALIFCSISMVSYTAGVYRAEDLILNGSKNNHVIQFKHGNRMECFLIKRFSSGDLVFYKNEPTFISNDSDRILRFRGLSNVTEMSTGVRAAAE